MLGGSDQNDIVCVHEAGDAYSVSEFRRVHPPPIKAIVNVYPRGWTAMKDIPHHAVHVDVGQDRAFHGALSDSAGDPEPFS